MEKAIDRAVKQVIRITSRATSDSEDGNQQEEFRAVARLMWERAEAKADKLAAKDRERRVSRSRESLCWGCFKSRIGRAIYRAKWREDDIKRWLFELGFSKGQAWEIFQAVTRLCVIEAKTNPNLIVCPPDRKPPKRWWPFEEYV
jgi:hypothetical protein